VEEPVKLPVDPFGAADHAAVDDSSHRRRTHLSAGFRRSLAGDLGEEV
jgi:hypothetical protein